MKVIDYIIVSGIPPEDVHNLRLQKLTKREEVELNISESEAQKIERSIDQMVKVENDLEHIKKPESVDIFAKLTSSQKRIEKIFKDFNRLLSNTAEKDSAKLIEKFRRHAKEKIDTLQLQLSNTNKKIEDAKNNLTELRSGGLELHTTPFARNQFEMDVHSLLEEGYVLVSGPSLSRGLIYQALVKYA